MSYYKESDLSRFGELASHRPDLCQKIMDFPEVHGQGVTFLLQGRLCDKCLNAIPEKKCDQNGRASAEQAHRLL